MCFFIKLYVSTKCKPSKLFSEIFKLQNEDKMKKVHIKFTSNTKYIRTSKFSTITIFYSIEYHGTNQIFKSLNSLKIN